MPSPEPTPKGRTADPRRAAFSILSRLDREPIDLRDVLEEAFSQATWDPRDRALAAELVYGTARWRFRLDPILRGLTGRRVKDLDRSVRTLLRLGAYQLLFLSRVPGPAAVDETVRLAGSDRRRRGFVNAVLRRLAEGEVPELPTDGPQGLAVEHALPDWLARRWWKRFGPAGAVARARHANTPAPLTLRVERARVLPDALADRLRAAGLVVEPSPVLDGALRVSASSPIREWPGYREGLFYVQDEASQWVGRLVGAESGERVLDACAAPGGKTTQLAAAVGPAGEVTALEADRGRIVRLRENLARLGVANVRVVTGDAATVSADALGAPFDRVLVDAPCSGLGVLGRHPEGKWWKGEGLVLRCAARQKQMLAHLAGLVRPGGALVYSVCTGEPEETVQVVTEFLNRHPAFTVRPADRVLGEGARPWLTAEGYFDTGGNGCGLDGFFAVHMVRNS